MPLSRRKLSRQKDGGEPIPGPHTSQESLSHDNPEKTTMSLSRRKPSRQKDGGEPIPRPQTSKESLSHDNLRGKYGGSDIDDVPSPAFTERNIIESSDEDVELEDIIQEEIRKDPLKRKREIWEYIDYFLEKVELDEDIQDNGLEEGNKDDGMPMKKYARLHVQNRFEKMKNLRNEGNWEKFNKFKDGTTGRTQKSVIQAESQGKETNKRLRESTVLGIRRNEAKKPGRPQKYPKRVGLGSPSQVSIIDKPGRPKKLLDKSPQRPQKLLKMNKPGKLEILQKKCPASLKTVPRKRPGRPKKVKKTPGRPRKGQNKTLGRPKKFPKIPGRPKNVQNKSPGRPNKIQNKTLLRPKKYPISKIGENDSSTKSKLTQGRVKESTQKVVPKKRPGRPKKVQNKTPGRPKKVKKTLGRPIKVTQKRPGRPKKVPEKTCGRPKKSPISKIGENRGGKTSKLTQRRAKESTLKVVQNKRPGRPKKVPKRPGRPRKAQNKMPVGPKKVPKRPGRPRKAQNKMPVGPKKVPKRPGRPKKSPTSKIGDNDGGSKSHDIHGRAKESTASKVGKRECDGKAKKTRGRSKEFTKSRIGNQEGNTKGEESQGRKKISTFSKILKDKRKELSDEHKESIGKPGPSSVFEMSVPDEIKRGRGRPRMIKLNKVGRPKRLFNKVKSKIFEKDCSKPALHKSISSKELFVIPSVSETAVLEKGKVLGVQTNAKYSIGKETSTSDNVFLSDDCLPRETQNIEEITNDRSELENHCCSLSNKICSGNVENLVSCEQVREKSQTEIVRNDLHSVGGYENQLHDEEPQDHENTGSYEYSSIKEKANDTKLLENENVFGFKQNRGSKKNGNQIQCNIEKVQLDKIDGDPTKLQPQNTNKKRQNLHLENIVSDENRKKRRLYLPSNTVESHITVGTKKNQATKRYLSLEDDSEGKSKEETYFSTSVKQDKRLKRFSEGIQIKSRKRKKVETSDTCPSPSLDSIKSKNSDSQKRVKKKLGELPTSQDKYFITRSLETGAPCPSTSYVSTKIKSFFSQKGQQKRHSMFSTETQIKSMKRKKVEVSTPSPSPSVGSIKSKNSVSQKGHQERPRIFPTETNNKSRETKKGEISAPCPSTSSVGSIKSKNSVSQKSVEKSIDELPTSQEDYDLINRSLSETITFPDLEKSCSANKKNSDKDCLPTSTERDITKRAIGNIDNCSKDSSPTVTKSFYNEDISPERDTEMESDLTDALPYSENESSNKRLKNLTSVYEKYGEKTIDDQVQKGNQELIVAEDALPVEENKLDHEDSEDEIQLKLLPVEKYPTAVGSWHPSMAIIRKWSRLLRAENNQKYKKPEPPHLELNPIEDVNTTGISAVKASKARSFFDLSDDEDLKIPSGDEEDPIVNKPSTSRTMTLCERFGVRILTKSYLKAQALKDKRNALKDRTKTKGCEAYRSTDGTESGPRTYWTCEPSSTGGGG